MFVMCGSQALVLTVLAACFTLGLLAKAMLVTLPFLLLLLDYWPLRRFAVLPKRLLMRGARPPASVSWLILEKLPLLVLVVATSIATIFAQERALGSGQFLADALAGRERFGHHLDLSAPDGLAGSSGAILSPSQGIHSSLDRHF